MIPLRKIGDSGLCTPPLILGANVFGWTADSATSFAVMDAFVAGGGRMIDKAVNRKP
jgi:aryl-alcohol dehydrogenase-like predicted oxidoreductase